MLRFYRIDLLDFYRGTLTARRIRVLVNHLPHNSALMRALNGGRPGWSVTDHLLADLWVLILRAITRGESTIEDHPVRAAMLEKAQAAAKLASIAELRERFTRRKRLYAKTSGGE